MKHRVAIGTCSGPAEAAFVRSVFDAHELPVVINGEMHAGAMGGLGGFVRLEIFVARDDAEEATALLRDIRAGEHALSEDDPVDDGADPGAATPEDADRDERADAEGVWQSRHASDAPEPGTPTASSVDAAPSAPASPRVFQRTLGVDLRRRRTGIALLLATFLPGFGAALMSTGAWVRGAALGVAQVVGFYSIVEQHPAGGWIVLAARVADVLGAVARIWRQPAPAPDAAG